jgi:hypothetical protein
MFTIISALVAEHRKYRAEFTQIERVLARTRSLAKVKQMARHVEAMLLDHAAGEEDLVLLALDHVPEHKQQSNRFHQEHQEIDVRLTQVQLARTLEEASLLLRSALGASRRHFKREEETVFPLIERLMGADRLSKLGRIWLMRNQGHAPWTSPTLPSQGPRMRAPAPAVAA